MRSCHFLDHSGHFKDLVGLDARGLVSERACLKIGVLEDIRRAVSFTYNSSHLHPYCKSALCWPGKKCTASCGAGEVDVKGYDGE